MALGDLHVDEEGALGHLAEEDQTTVEDHGTGNLDPHASSEIMDLLRRINMRGTAILMATHNYDLVRKYPARIVKLDNGKLFEVELKERRDGSFLLGLQMENMKAF